MTCRCRARRGWPARCAIPTSSPIRRINAECSRIRPGHRRGDLDQVQQPRLREAKPRRRRDRALVRRGVLRHPAVRVRRSSDAGPVPLLPLARHPRDARADGRVLREPLRGGGGSGDRDHHHRRVQDRAAHVLHGHPGAGRRGADPGARVGQLYRAGTALPRQSRPHPPRRGDRRLPAVHHRADPRHRRQQPQQPHGQARHAERVAGASPHRGGARLLHHLRRGLQRLRPRSRRLHLRRGVRPGKGAHGRLQHPVEELRDVRVAHRVRHHQRGAALPDPEGEPAPDHLSRHGAADVHGAALRRGARHHRAPDPRGGGEARGGGAPAGRDGPSLHARRGDVLPVRLDRGEPPGVGGVLRPAARRARGQRGARNRLRRLVRPVHPALGGRGEHGAGPPRRGADRRAAPRDGGGAGGEPGSRGRADRRTLEALPAV